MSTIDKIKIKNVIYDISADYSNIENAPTFKTINDQSVLGEGNIELVTTQVIISKNLYQIIDKNSEKQFLTASTGETKSTTSDYRVSDYIAVNQAGKYVTTSYTINKCLLPFSVRSICAYRNDKSYISGTENVAKFIIPEDTEYIRICVSSAFTNAFNYEPQLEITDDGIPTFYVPYKQSAIGIDEQTLANNKTLTLENINNNFACAIPKKVYGIVGESLKIFNKNILSHPKYNIAYYTKRAITTGALTRVDNFDDYGMLSFTSAGKSLVPYEIYDDNYNIVYKENIEVNTTSNIAPTTTIMVIGDSTVAQNNSQSHSSLISWLKSYFGETNPLTLLGTRGSTEYEHEGRSGWKAEEYCTIASKSNVINAFWNSTTSKFDFSYYMETYYPNTTLNTVFIQLGINDLISSTIKDFKGEQVCEYIDEIVTSIKEYASFKSATINIVVNMPIPPNSDGTSFSNAYAGEHVEWMYRYSIIKYNYLLNKKYYFDDNVDILGVNVPIDTYVEISDGVHPNQNGYKNMAKTMYDYLANKGE